MTLPSIEESASPAGRILIVDDETELGAALSQMLNRQGYTTEAYNDPRAALAALLEGEYDVLLVDLMMPEMDGITLLRHGLEHDPNLIGVIMTGQGTVQTAVEAMKTGAFDYLLKPFKLNTVLSVLARAMEVRQLRAENFQLKEMLNIYELGQAVALKLDLDQILEKTAEVVQAQSQADEISILLSGDENDDLLLAEARGQGRQWLVGQRVPVEGTISGWVAQHREPLALHGQVQDTRFSPLRPRPEIKTGLSLPMVHGDKLIGIVNINILNRPQTLTAGQMRGLSTLINIATSALENAQLYNAVQAELQARGQRERELETLAAVSFALRTTNTCSEMIPVILDEVCKALEPAAAAIGLIDTVNQELVTERGFGLWSDRVGVRLSLQEGIPGQVIESRQPYYNNQMDREPPELIQGWSEDLPTVVCVPLIAQEAVLGVMGIARQNPVSEAEVRLLASVGDIAASSIQRASLHEQTVRRLNRLSALRMIDLAISSSLDLRITLNILLDQVVSQLSVDAAAVQLVDPHTHVLEYAAGRGFRTSILKQASRGFDASKIVLEGESLNLPDMAEAQPDPFLDKLRSDEGVQALFATPLTSKGEIIGILEVFLRAPFHPDREWLEFLEALAGQAAIAIDSARLFDNLQLSNRQLVQAYNATIEGWSRALDLRDKETEGHTQRVTNMTLRVAQVMGAFDEAELVDIRRGALLHDIGKMGVPDGILLKPGPLADEEWEIMRRHPEYAYQLLAPVAYLKKALDIPRYHHERWDGSGYPFGLKGDQIPLAARIFSVVDVWDALRSDRPYREGWPEEKVRAYIQSLAGKQFDPRVVEVFLQAIDE